MSQPFAEVLSWVPKTRHLAATLARSHDYARALGHAQVTLEHLLLALMEDPDASLVLQACAIDALRLTNDVNAYLDQLPVVQQPTLEADAGLMRILDYAVAAAQQSRRREVNGAIVLAAIVGEGKNEAASILRSNGLTFAEAIKALQSTSVTPRTPSAAASAQATLATEEILAETRRRIEASRGGPSQSQPPPAPQPEARAMPEPDANLPPPVVAADSPAPPLPHSWAPSPQLPPENEHELRRPPPIPAMPNLDLPAPAANGQWHPGAYQPPARDLAAEAMRSANAPWPEADARPPPPPPRKDAPANSPPPIAPFPDPDELPARSPPSTGSLRAAISTGRVRPVQPFEPGQLVENIPRRMRMGVSQTVEVRIGRAQAASIASGLDGTGAAYQHSVVVTKAMAVRLRAPEGGFYVETASPETQWIDNTLGLLNDDFASWRWTVTPQRRGRGRLQLILSARTVGSDGMAAETALPDQVVEVHVRTNYGRTIRVWAGWLTAAVVGGLLAKVGEGALDAGLATLKRFIG